MARSVRTWRRGKEARGVVIKVVMTGQRTRDVVATKVQRLEMARVKMHQMEIRDYARRFSEVPRSQQHRRLLSIAAHTFHIDRGAGLAS